MIGNFDLVLRQVQLPNGDVADVGIKDRHFASIAPKLPSSDNDIDGRGKLLLPGLHDHHIHLLATAAKLQSVNLSGITDPGLLATALHAKAASLAPGDWIRAVGYDERAAGIPDRHILDRWVADRPLRLQDRTGALWALNSAALALIGDGPWPDSVEIDAKGHPTGRIWRGDDWLRSQIGAQPPSLDPLSRQLAGWGVTAVTDAGAHNGPDEASILSAAIRSGELLQRLTMMGREDLPVAPEYSVGAVKLLFDERALPDIGHIVTRISAAREAGRVVAAHCVTEAELVTYLAALDMAGGAHAGDRIEHGSMIPESLISDIAKAGLILVANPGFIAIRGDRYLAEVDPLDHANLHRLASLEAGGISILAGSDAPYGPPNPWLSIHAAVNRITASRANFGRNEAISANRALALFSGNEAVAVGGIADCCLVDDDWATSLASESDPQPVHTTLIGGTVRYSRGR